MSYLNKIRLVFFLFCMMETLANIVLMRIKLTGCYVVYKSPQPLLQEWLHFCYLVAFYIFTVQNLFAGVSLCTRNQPSLLYELMRPLISNLLYYICAWVALLNAKSDLETATKKWEDEPLPKTPLHPYFNFKNLRCQAKAAMVCCIIHVLHSIVALYVLQNEDNDGETSSSGSSDEVLGSAVGDYTSLEAEGN